MKIGRRGAAVAPVAIVLVVAGAFALRAANTIAGAPLELATAPANATGLCNAARLVPVTVGHADGRLTFRNGQGAELSLVWPDGYRARLVNGIGELLDPNGSIVARDGDTLSGIGGGGDPFTICLPS